MLGIGSLLGLLIETGGVGAGQVLAGGVEALLLGSAAGPAGPRPGGPAVRRRDAGAVRRRLPRLVLARAFQAVCSIKGKTCK
jgi:hypothetical protein